MKQLTTYFLLIFPCIAFAQETTSEKKSDFVFTPEIKTGILAEANKDFPEHDLPISIFVNFGWEHDRNPQDWAQRLKGPRTGVGLGYTHLGNSDSLGASISAIPFIEFNVFKKKNLKVHVGMGGSYFTKKYDPVSNPNNQGVTTDLVWTFKAFMNYQILSGDKVDWRLGAGYFHHSNGHTRLPNQGFNSFLFSLSADIKSKPLTDANWVAPVFNPSVYNFTSFRAGYGINVLSKAEGLNDKKPIYTFAGEYGKVYDNTFKLGVGFYYRFYQHYYDYIVDNESLVQDGREFESFKDNPFSSASNFGIHASGEVLLNHFGIEVQLGFNLHKPAYKIDWRINQGWTNVPRIIPAGSNIVLGEFTTKYKLKQYISSRMGLKYYLIGTKKAPKNNLYLGFHIDSNFGQADFTELSLGYVYSFNFKKR